MTVHMWAGGGGSLLVLEFLLGLFFATIVSPLGVGGMVEFLACHKKMTLESKLTKVNLEYTIQNARCQRGKPIRD